MEEAEIIARVRAAAQDGRPLQIVGRGTKRHLGPAGSGEELSLRDFARVVSHEPGDLIVSVQAGARLVEVQGALGKHGQWLPVDPPFADATIGGILATASHGPRRLGYGPVKDHLLGLRVLGADGVVTRSGGRVVKNVSGYDLHKLHVGAFGSLGVILEAHFKVQPRPAVSGAVLFGARDHATAHRRLLDVWGTKLRPVALEVLSAPGPALRALAPGDGALAIVGVEGSAAVFERHRRELGAFAPTGMIVLPDAGALWAALRDEPDRRRDDVTIRLGARPHDLPALLDGIEAPVQISAGVGVARVFLRASDQLGTRVRGWRTRAAALGGYAVVESAPLGPADRAELPWSVPGPSLGRALKQAWDPARLLNPGRMAL